jgi:hypothetical protein
MPVYAAKKHKPQSSKQRKKKQQKLQSNSHYSSYSYSQSRMPELEIMDLLMAATSDYVDDRIPDFCQEFQDAVAVSGMG